MLWIGLYVVEILMFYTPLWRGRKFLAPFLGVTSLVLVSSSYLFIEPHYLFVLWPLTLFRIFNLARVFKSRMHNIYLRRVTRRTSLVLAVLHVVGIWALLPPLLLPVRIMFFGFLLAQAVLCALILFITIKNIRKLAFKMPGKFLSDKELPTVTVAIPARNETKELEDCLRAVLASDYPKLEVLVLDDCSQAKTAEVIKSFAHAGVRFVKGEEPAERWLAKNQAYQKLYQQASGQLVLFCGVDVRLGTGAIRAMVNLLHARNKSMLSVLPLRVAGEPSTTLFQPMRYWWELAIPRRLLNRPAVLSTCWLIERKTLKKLGGFASVSHSITPEAFFARELVKTDGYSFVRHSEELDVRTLKKVSEQQATTLRVRYPQFRRRPENVLAITILELVVFAAPLATIAYLLVTRNTEFIILPIFSLLCVFATHIFILQVTNPVNVFVAILTFPLAALTELFVNYVSMFKYEFGTVEWKNRNICIPVMHVYPKLPALKD